MQLDNKNIYLNNFICKRQFYQNDKGNLFREYFVVCSVFACDDGAVSGCNLLFARHISVSFQEKDL